MGQATLRRASTAGAIIDRFLHHAQVIAITGKSYRVKEAPVLTQENKKSRKSNEPLAAGGRELEARSSALPRFNSQPKPLD